MPEKTITMADRKIMSLLQQREKEENPKSGTKMIKPTGTAPIGLNYRPIDISWI